MNNNKKSENKNRTRVGASFATMMSRVKTTTNRNPNKEKEEVEGESRGPEMGEKKKKTSRPFSFKFSPYSISKRYSIKEQAHFAKRLAFLIRSGVPVLESLNILRKQTRSKVKGKILDVIIEDVTEGRYLSAGLGRFRSSFGDFAINVVRVGEMSGTLSGNLTYLAEELQKRQALKRKLVGALVYPAFITVATVAVTVLLTVYIFPKVMPVFTSLNVTLPFTTRVILFVSQFLSSWGFYLFGACTVAVIALVFFVRKSEKLHYFVSRNILRLPVIGRLILEYNIVNFCRTFSLLLKSGFNVVETARITADATANPVYKKEAQELQKKIIQGERISKHLEANRALFPDIMSHMVMIGETSGTLSDTLMYLAGHYEDEVEDLIKNLSSSIEPILMIFMGVIVGFVAVSVITPIYEITQSLQR